MKHENDKPTEWMLYECQNGSRWSISAMWLREKPEGECGFSGCPGPPHAYRAVKTSQDRDEVSAWFHRAADGQA